MIKLSTRLVCASLLMAGALNVGAIPAKPRPFVFTQPDGSAITVTLRGDERAHCYLSDDGCILLNHDNALYYAMLDAQGHVQPSALLAQEANRRTPEAVKFLESVDQAKLGEALSKQAQLSGRGHHISSSKMSKAPSRSDDGQDEGFDESKKLYGLFPSNNFPAYGERRGLVVLVEYQDVEFCIEDPNTYFSRMLNEEGWSEDNGTGSARDYFMACSNGNFMPTFDVYGPVTLPNDRAYYGGNDSWGNDRNPEQMAIHACDILDDEVDFSQYDSDGDGFIDMVYIFYAGRGEADGGGASTVWPHQWDISSATNTIHEYDGVRLEHYACGNEIQMGDIPDGIGTFVHEFSHAMGLPDLYATNYTSAFTPGAYSILDYGPYNNNSHTPPIYSIFERSALGWADVEILTEPGEYQLEAIEKSNHGYMLPTEKETEYFLFENRQQEGWDTYIPGHGMLIWHIDYVESVWTYNTVNNKSSHQYVDIIEADNNKTESTRDGDPFPGVSNVTKITDYTTPNLHSWAGQSTNYPINLITESEEGVISFYGGPRPDFKPETPEALEAENVTFQSFTARWNPVTEADYYVITVTDGDGETLTKWDGHIISSGTLANIGDLDPLSVYRYSVYAVADQIKGDASNVIEVNTPNAPFNYHRVSALEATDVTANSFVANWEDLDLAQEFVINVNEIGLVENPQYVVDFTDGISSMPAGWSTTTTLIYNKEENCGEAPPALRFASPGNVASCTYDNQITGVKFWYRGVNTNEENQIQVQVTDGASWSTIATFNPSNDGGQTAEATEVPEGYYRMRLLYVEKSHLGAVAIDDVVVATDGSDEAETALEGYVDRSVGKSLSCKVEGLKPDTQYKYSVTANDGELWCKESKSVYVTTSHDAGVSSVVADSENDIRVVGRTVYSSGASAYSVDGRLVGVGAAITLSPGIYVIHSGTAVQKVTIK